MSLSIVVIGRNEGARLMRCLASVQAATPRDAATELIYVDSCSSDGSPQRAAAAGVRTLVLKQGRLSAARARNAGWRAAAAPLILFLDGDTVLHPLFIERARAALCDPDVAVVFGHRREMDPGASLYQRVLDLEWVSPVGPAGFCGGDAMMRRAALEQAGGYDAGLIAGEEPDLCRRIRAAGGGVLHIDAPMVTHDLAITRAGQYWKHAVRTGHAYAEVAARYRTTPDPLWTRESRRNLLRGPLVVAAIPAMAIAAVAVHSGAFAAACGGVVAAVIARTAWRARWRGGSLATLLLFAAHSHLQQIPIFCGQMTYRWARLRNRKRALIEYKPEAL